MEINEMIITKGFDTTTVYDYNRACLELCKQFTDITTFDVDYNGEYIRIHLIKNKIIPISSILMIQYGVTRLNIDSDIIEDILNHHKKIEYLKTHDSDKRYINTTEDKSHRNLVGGLPLNVMFDENVISAFENNKLSGYFKHPLRTMWFDKIIIKCLDHIQVNLFSNWLLSEAAYSFVDFFSKDIANDDRTIETRIIEMIPRIKDISRIVYNPNFDGTLQSFKEIENLYQELNII
jgi:hypothetical protein